ncbi:ras and Rab interactor 1-like isoform X2 [Scleropages formosus]|nr:ras and Rab interactor 1 isoform X2 [Scleropages formosus]XP_029106846.1 ras and Rab interactor 1 isoform X2 [Scleropages formosus]
MQEAPVYDYPDPHPLAEKRVCPQRGSLKSISVLDRLLLTHPVWLQLSINAATALHILQREPPGTFLVRKSTTSQKKVLCVRLEDDSVPSFVKQVMIREEGSSKCVASSQFALLFSRAFEPRLTGPRPLTAFSLESSAIGFPDLCRLIAFYCVSRDVLPFTLELPEAIAKAASHKQLESISHMGVEFWSSQLNYRGPRDGPPPAPTLTAEECVTPEENPTLLQEFCPIRTRSPLELDCGSGRGALCFVNPLFLQEQPGRGAPHRRLQFKRSIKVRVSTETSSQLSPPSTAPPPPPLLAKGARRAAAGGRGRREDPAPVREASRYLEPSLPERERPGAAGAVGKKGLSPTQEEDEYQMPKVLQKCWEERNAGGEADDDDDEAALPLERRRAPSLTELDSSSSLSSLEESEESPERPALMRGTSTPAAPVPPPQPVSTLRKMSAIFMSFFAPGKRVARLVEELSRDRRSAFGALVQDFLRQQREEVGKSASAVSLLQGLRLFLSQAKDFLLDCRELEPPIETLVPENEKDLALEKALFRCVLKPLKGRLDSALRLLHERDGSLRLLADGLRATRDGPLERFGVRVAVLDAGGVERIRQKLALMQRAYSPVDKVVLLLQVCKAVYQAMRGDAAQQFGADEFLPALSYVLVQCNMPELLLEVEYMMELLDPSWLTGEGGYYLTSVYASLCLIQSQPEAVPPGGVTRKARESLTEWSRRRSKDAQQQKDNQKQQTFVRVLFQDGDCSSVKTLRCKVDDSGEALAGLCAASFGVAQPENYALYWRAGEGAQPLPAHVRIQDLRNQSGGAPSLAYQPCDEDAGKMRRLTRGGAVDLAESN